ncbi:stalk domain-containing protein [Paenibacillus assamensis]|uniref:stalk domain-containing protein n=1 Tax=Paenibacillus assamensis TaxID=311244 RepID=UPI0004069C8D|nr:stalk domain-containing protein [Paenibacillus assamensis]
MKMVKMKKSIFIATMVSVSLMSGAVAVVASNGMEKISAFLNHKVQFKVDGNEWTPKSDNGSKLAPVVYKGTTYLPARAVGEAVGAEVKWNGTTQTITIHTGKGSTGGTSTPTEKPTKPVEVPQANGIIKLGNKEETTKKMREQAVTLIKLYGEALETGSTKKYDEYITKITADKYPDSPIRNGHQHYKDMFKKKVDEVIAANSKEKIADYAKAMKAVTLDQVEVFTISDKNEYSQSFSFKYFPKGWTAFSSTYVYFEFGATKYKSTDFELFAAYIN